MRLRDIEMEILCLLPQEGKTTALPSIIALDLKIDEQKMKDCLERLDILGWIGYSLSDTGEFSYILKNKWEKAKEMCERYIARKELAESAPY